ncbi:hypothetical protein EDB89DRAFT_2075640 [Lactarius sanguifluus]|nr:hypothetical protein EDB89DRAFT_2075640 [Lactarius sanguifluus]
MTPADRRRLTTRSVASPAAATAPASRGSSQLAQGFKTLVRISSSVSKSRERMRGKSDFASREKHPPATHHKHKCSSDDAAFTRPSATRLGVKDDPAYHLTRFRLPREHAHAQDVVTQPRPCGLPQLTARTVDVQGVSSHPTDTRSDLRNSRASTLTLSPPSRLRRKTPHVSHGTMKPQTTAFGQEAQQTRDDFTPTSRASPRTDPAAARIDIAPSPATARLAPRTLKTLAIGTRTASERPRRTRMPEDSQYFISNSAIRSRTRSHSLALSRFLPHLLNAF